ncbi:restriction endonuclease subunit S [Clostridium perfringens]|uniref:restriction endonuclease subunit S n=2 Tax=Clostridium perfringens TaxID=1502 RepID=UPI000166999C|nr:restriction endonuclease subunit S [Clostridium perfringens]EDS78852.1 restriction modification system DNA specificity domain [Clostridium perfringens C str. JGS1495]ELC8449298.1 restriction endonuclease subunit S [Clostridium perfringens]MDM0830527.1 restriction endonuclease subunit S [Clostridium perfringens]MDY4419386.1 restriction endonuclease subunit S [Clostridium perfringens]NGT75258.1 restriction endonuclease subunit S [Clostridium perfringens]
MNKKDVLKNLIEIDSGYAFKSSFFNDNFEGIPIIRIRDINSGIAETYYSGDYEEKFIVNNDDLLIGMDGNFKIRKWSGGKALLNQRVCRIKSISNKLSNEYLYRILPLELKLIEDKTSFVTVKHLSVKDINNIELIIPDIDIQNKIVKIIDKSQELIDNRKKQIEELDLLVKSKFIEMFGTPIEKRFIGKTLPEIIAEGRYSLKRGPFGGSLKKDDFIQEGYLVYEQRHAIHNDFDYAKYYISKDKYDEMIMFKVEPKDLLVSCSGVTLGRISEVPEGAKAGIINQALLKITLNQDIMNNIYFMQLFRNEQIQDKLFGFSRGSGIPNFPSMSEVKSMEFLCPPIELQNKFADFVNNIDKLKFEMEKSLKELEDNFNSLMQKAFKGELFK